jgi:Putative carbohydrate metabolism domain
MKATSKIFSVAIILFSYSCIQENHFGESTEKKILSFKLENQVGNTQLNQETRSIVITVSAEAQLTSLKAIEISASTFAKVSPAIGEAQDFTSPVTYTVIAEDGSTAEYTVTVKQEGSEPQLDNTSFDTWYTTPKGYQEPGLDANSIWATGNAGTVTLGSPNVTPLEIIANDRAAKLVTLDLGNLAGVLGQRMGAGSLFTGKFQLDIANPLNSTKFGIPFTARPKKFSVKYAYSPGSPYLNKNGQTLAKKDSCDVYVLLENREGAEVKRVATGWFRSGEEKIDQFYTITVDLVYGTLGANVPAYQKPANGLYGAANEKVTHLTVVFSSSYNGALFEGGTNSTLVVNDFNLIY